MHDLLDNGWLYQILCVVHNNHCLLHLLAQEILNLYNYNNYIVVLVMHGTLPLVNTATHQTDEGSCAVGLECLYLNITGIQ